MITLGSKLKERAEILGISNAEAAKRCGLDRRRYGHYVTGRSRPNYETLIKICDALGTTPNLLLSYNGDSYTPELQQLLVSAKTLGPAEVSVLVATVEALNKRSV